MSQNTARHDPRDKSEKQDVTDLPTRRPERSQAEEPRRPAGPPAGAGGIGADDPDEDEAGLIGGDDLSDVDLGPAAPGFRDPDANSGRIRK